MDANNAHSIPLTTNRALDDAVERAFRRHLADFNVDPLTEPLGVGQWAALFDVHRQTMSSILRKTDGAEQFGRLWRLPLSKAPPKYWIDRGLLRSADDSSVDSGR